MYRSPQYCGVRPKINHTNPDNAYKAANARGSSNKIRYYVEEKDDEMDLWLKVAGGDRNRYGIVVNACDFKLRPRIFSPAET